MKTEKHKKDKKLIPSTLVGCGAEKNDPNENQIQYADYC